MRNDTEPVRTAEIVAVGTELLLGEIIDTNGAALARILADHGVDTFHAVRVGDNLERIVQALRLAASRADLVLVSGGLGPTDDDLTREAIAAVTGRTPYLDEEQERILRARFQRSGRAMPERNLKQAWLLPDAEALANPHGTAPGWLVRQRLGERLVRIAALPGPPHELLPMVRERLLPRLRLPESRLTAVTLKSLGVGESQVAERLGRLTAAADPSVATYAKEDGVHVRIATKAAAAEAVLAPVVAEVEEALADAVWGRDDDELAGVVLRLLARHDWTLACSERGSGGALAVALAEADPERGRFAGGVVAWRADAKGTYGDGASDERGQAALDAASEARATFGVEIAVAVGEPRSTDGDEGGATVWLAVQDPQGEDRAAVHLAGRPLGPRARAHLTIRALDLLRRRLATLDPTRSAPMGA